MRRAPSIVLVAAIALSFAAPAAAQRGGRGQQGMSRNSGFSGRDMVSRKFDAAAPGIGESMPEITVYDAAGNPLSLNELLEGHYSVVVLGCLT